MTLMTVLSAVVWHAATGVQVESCPFIAETPQARAWEAHDTARRASVAHAQRVNLVREELRELRQRLDLAEVGNRLDQEFEALDRYNALVAEKNALAEQGARLAAVQARAEKALETALLAGGALPWAA